MADAITVKREANLPPSPMAATLTLPAYSGDGTRCDAYTLEMAVFEPDGVRRARSRVLVPPWSQSLRPAPQALESRIFRKSAHN